MTPAKPTENPESEEQERIRKLQYRVDVEIRKPTFGLKHKLLKDKLKKLRKIKRRRGAGI